MIFVSKENLSHNYRQIDKFSGNSTVISVIKGDGYGHGLLECCKILKSSNCKNFYVARLDDAIKLREKFKNINIYLLSGVISKLLISVCKIVSFIESLTSSNFLIDISLKLVFLI